MHRVSSACFALALASALAGCRSKVDSPDTGPGRPSVVRAAGPTNGHAAAPVIASAGVVADQLPKDGLSLTTGLSWDAAGVALSADGKLLVTVGGYFAKPELKVWPLPVGKAARELPGQSGPVLAVSFAPASTVLAAGDFDGNVLVRDLDSGKELFARKASPGQVRSVALAAAGKTLATGGGWLDFGSQKAFGEVKVWDTAGGGPRHFKGHDGLVLGVALTADGKLLASASSDKTVRLWDVAAGKELKKLEGHTADVNSVALSADGKLLASGGKDKLVIVWDVSSGKPAHTLKGHTGEVTSVALSADGKLLASGGKDKTVRLWDTASGKEVATVKAPDEVLGVALTPDGKVLAAGGRGKSAKVWSVAAVRK